MSRRLEPRSGGGRDRALGGATRLLSLALCLAAATLGPSPARGQEIDRASENPESRREVAPITSRGRLRPSAETRGGPKVVPVDLDYELFPEARQAEEPAPSETEWIRLGGKLWAAAGFDDNVFRAERDRTGDGFGQAHAEANLLLKLPTAGELFVEVAGESLIYFERERADEHYTSAFVEYYQPVLSWLELGVQNAFEFSRLNLLDDNGDLFPRGRFGSTDEEARAFAVLGFPVEALSDLSLEVGSSFRLKDYQENAGLESLDYLELRCDAAIRWKLSNSPRSRLKLKYRFRRRDYREFRARGRDGVVGPDSPHLDLERHQLDLRWSQRMLVGQSGDRPGVQLRITAEAGVSYNRDDFQNDRSYRQTSGLLSVELWPVKDWTRFEVSVRAIGRDFVSRQPNGRGGRLRHRLARLRVGLWQQVWVRDKNAPPEETVRLAVFCSYSLTFWRSSDLGEDYDRSFARAGLELSW